MRTTPLRRCLAGALFLAAASLSLACDDNYDPDDDPDPMSTDEVVTSDPDTGSDVLLLDSGVANGNDASSAAPAPSPPAVPLSQTVASSDQTITYGTTQWSPPYDGGAGTGAWQFVVSDYTDWQSGGWTPPAAGNFIFYVQNVGDGNYAAATAGPYNLAVLPADNGTVGISPASQTILAGQSISFTAGGGATGNYSWGGAASGGGGSQTVGFNSAGNYAVTVQDVGDGNTNPSNTASAAVTVVNPAPPSAAISATPASGIAPLVVTVSWSVANADSAAVSGPDLSSAQSAGSQTVTLATPGTYTWMINASGSGGQTTTAATAAAGGYSLQTLAVGAGSVTPGGGPYAAGTPVSVSASPGAQGYFTGWSGDAGGSANPLALTLNGNMTVYANFSSRLAQTIAFAPPANASYPGPAVNLVATASSGLPVAFALLSGPATLAGSQLTLTQAGPVVVQASQAGNAEWLAAPPVTGTLAVAAAASVVRIRFNATGLDARTTGPGAGAGGAEIWTDPALLPVSPWPSFQNPQAAVPAAPGSVLSAVPAAPTAPP